MTKKEKMITFSVLGILGVICLLICLAPKKLASDEKNVPVKIKESVADPAYTELSVKIEKQGKYDIVIDCTDNETPKFITGATFMHGKDKILYTTAGICFRDRRKALELEPGLYVLRIDHIASADAFIKLNNAQYPGGMQDMPTVGSSDDGEYFMSYKLKVVESKPYYTFALCLGIVLIGIMVSVIFLSGSDRKSRAEEKYDERQTAVRGRSYRQAFYVLLIYFLVLVVLRLFNADLPLSDWTLIAMGLLLAEGIQSSFSIYNDAYFKFKENPLIGIQIFFICAVILGACACISYFGQINKNLPNGREIGLIYLLTAVFSVFDAVLLCMKEAKNKREERYEKP